MSFGRKHGSGDYSSFLNDISSWADNDFAELVWENGQLMVKSQAPLTGSSHFAASGAHADAEEEQSAFSKTGKFVDVETFLPDKPSLLSSGEVDLCPNDEVVPWLGYPFGNYSEQQYSPKLLPEVSRDMGSGFSTYNNSVENMNGGGVSNVLHACIDTSKASNFPGETSVLLSPQDTRISGDAGFEVLDFSSTQTEDKIEGRRKGLPMPASKWVNFPHFSKLTTSLPKPSEVSSSVLSAERKLQSRGKSLAVDDSSEKCRNPVLYDSRSKDAEFHGPFVSDAVSNFEQPVINLLDEERNDVSEKDAAIINNEKCPTSVDWFNEIPGDGRSLETHVACSSTGIAPGADLISCNQTKFDDNEDSQSHSNDSVSECDGSKRPIPPRKSSGSKRRRIAEVHNRSEKRRRSRINEKMKELQELLPNSIKTDKASMLDQATEYLRMLKHQVQVMSMGAGICMVPTMLPPGMQAVYPSRFTPFPQMGVGSGMGAGFGVGMPPDARFPMTPMQLPHLPMPVPGQASFARAACPSVWVYGHPGQVELPPPTFHPNSQHPVIPAAGVSGYGGQGEQPPRSPAAGDHP